MEKKKNNYKESQFEKYIKAKSKQEVEEEFNNKNKEEENDEEKKKQEIYDNIKKDLNEYKDFLEYEGTSENYNWNIITDLYDIKLRNFDDILEGYIVSSGDFIEQESNIKYAKDYIKELVGFYSATLNEEELVQIKKRLFNLISIVIDIAFETPKIYDIYAYLIYILIENQILEKDEMENTFKNKLKKEGINMDIYKKIEEYLKRYYQIIKRKLNY